MYIHKEIKLFLHFIKRAKPGKPSNEVTSYLTISLLPALPKVFEKLLVKRLKVIVDKENFIPVHQVGLGENHTTVEQAHQVRDVIT